MPINKGRKQSNKQTDQKGKGTKKERKRRNNKNKGSKRRVNLKAPNYIYTRTCWATTDRGPLHGDLKK
jgi:hypothetical protein